VAVKKTAAEVAFESAQSERRRAELKKSATKSHKEKVAEFNEKLAKLSDHYDIPKVRQFMGKCFSLFRLVQVNNRTTRTTEQLERQNN
jgi:hypothetical protein